MTVLFICRGNICRSPMAMALFRHMAESRSVPLKAISAGYHEWDCTPHDAHPFARQAIQELSGSDLLADHLAARWTVDMVRSSHLIVVAEEWMKSDFPQGKAVTMREMAGRMGDVEDPYGRDYSVFLDCAVEIRELLLEGWSLLASAQEQRP